MKLLIEDGPTEVAVVEKEVIFDKDGHITNYFVILNKPAMTVASMMTIWDEDALANRKQSHATFEKLTFLLVQVIKIQSMVEQSAFGSLDLDFDSYFVMPNSQVVLGDVTTIGLLQD